jgi:hypothetical protein
MHFASGLANRFRAAGLAGSLQSDMVMHEPGSKTRVATRGEELIAIYRETSLVFVNRG